MTSTSFDIWVFDSSVLIDIQRQMIARSRDELLQQMLDLARAHRLVFPQRVTDELTRHEQKDAVARWAVRAKELVPRHYVPADELVREVLKVAPTLIPTTQVGKSADAHVIAQALAYQRESMFHTVTVVTNDRVDRLPLKSSMTSACKLIGLQQVDLDGILAMMGFVPLWR